MTETEPRACNGKLYGRQQPIDCPNRGLCRRYKLHRQYMAERSSDRILYHVLAIHGDAKCRHFIPNNS